MLVQQDVILPVDVLLSLLRLFYSCEIRYVKIHLFSCFSHSQAFVGALANIAINLIII